MVVWQCCTKDWANTLATTTLPGSERGLSQVPQFLGELDFAGDSDVFLVELQRGVQ
jgi:hypothetical protein